MMPAMRQTTALVRPGSPGRRLRQRLQQRARPVDARSRRPAPTMAVRVPDGVVCGTMTCSVGQSCCITVGASGTTDMATCLAAGGTCSGATLACDGPEDCSGTPFCCGTVTFTGGTNPDAGAPVFQGGTASCAATCDFNFAQGPPSAVTTRMCHADDDCAGLSTAGGQIMLGQCCSSSQAPGLHFCAAPSVSAASPARKRPAHATGEARSSPRNARPNFAARFVGPHTYDRRETKPAFSSEQQWLVLESGRAASADLRQQLTQRQLGDDVERLRPAERQVVVRPCRR